MSESEPLSEVFGNVRFRIRVRKHDSAHVYVRVRVYVRVSGPSITLILMTD